MSVPQLPAGFEDLKRYLEDVETRVGNLESPQQPTIQAYMVSTNLTTSNAKTFTHGLVYLTDLNQLAYSNGAHWYKLAVGSLII